MSLKIKTFQIISFFIHVWKNEASSNAGYVYIEGNLSDPNLLANSCLRNWLVTESGFLCELSESDDIDSSDRATQIEIANILNMVGSHLTGLFIENTIIRDIPETVCRLKQLKRLYLEYNKLTTLSPTDCFAGMDQLEELDFTGNQISDLPGGIFKDLHQLRYLNLDTNHISVHRGGILDNLQQLTDLNVSDNALSSLSEGIFADLTHLHILNLNKNLISDLPNRIFKDLPNLWM